MDLKNKTLQSIYEIKSESSLISVATFFQINRGHSTASARLMIQTPYGVRNSVRPSITHGRHLAAKLSSSKVRELQAHYL